MSASGEITCNPPGQPSAEQVSGPQPIRGKTSTNQAPKIFRDGEAVPEQQLVAEVPEETEFQTFVATSVGHRLPMFGYNLFRGVPTTFAPVTQIPVPEDYAVGPGDEVLIRGWGQIDVDLRATVDRTGNIYVPRVGNVNLAGLKYPQLQPFLKTAIGRVYKNFDLAVNLGQLRSIQVFVVGQAKRPGSYTISSLSTLVNAIFASAGPSSKGSMRNIQVKRGSRAATEFDLYDLLIRGDKSKDIALMPGDVIYVAPIGQLVAVSGSVNVPAIYELKGKTTLGEAINLAGGLSTTAAGQKMMVERIEDRNARVVREFTTDAQGMSQELRDGDVIKVIPISPKFDDVVTLRGNVALPGRYPWRQGMRIKDLIPNREFLVTREYWQNQNLLTRNQDAGLASLAELREPDQLAVHTRLDQAAIKNEVRRSAPEINWDYALVQRLDRQDLSTRLIPFNLRKAILDGEETSNLLLQSGDVVTIFSQADITVPVESQSKFVRLEGEFAAAGVYRLEQGETLRHLVARAGGLTPPAYLFGAEFTRESARLDQQRRMEQFVQDLEREVERKVSSAKAVLAPEDVLLVKERSESQRKLVEKLRQAKATGKIVLGIKPTDTRADVLPDIILEDGDRFAVPYRPSTVNVLGAVYNENSFVYKGSERIKDYLQLAGGATRSADARRMFVIRADGSVVGRRATSGMWSGGLSHLRMMPGDTIVVPENLERVSFLRGLKDWSQIIGSFGLGAAAIRVLTRP